MPSTSCDLCIYRVWSLYVKRFRRRCIYKKIQYLTFKVTRNVAQYPLHHVTYSATKFEVDMSKGLGGDAFTRKFNIWPLTLSLGSRSREMLPSTLYIMWPIQLQSLKLLRLKPQLHTHDFGPRQSYDSPRFVKSGYIGMILSCTLAPSWCTGMSGSSTVMNLEE